LHALTRQAIPERPAGRVEPKLRLPSTLLTAAAAGGSLHVSNGPEDRTEIANHYLLLGWGLLADVGALCGLDIDAAARFTALDGLRVLTPPGRRDAAPLDAKLEDEDLPPPCAILSAAVLP
jgi:hypothetical protein